MTIEVSFARKARLNLKTQERAVQDGTGQEHGQDEFILKMVILMMILTNADLLGGRRITAADDTYFHVTPDIVCGCRGIERTTHQHQGDAD